MSRTSRRACLALLALGAVEAAAQGPAGPSADRLEQQRRLDSMAAVHRGALAALVAFDDSVGRVRRQLDTITVHPFHMLVERELAPVAGVSARAAARHFQTRAPLASASIAKRRLVVRSERSRTDQPDPVVIAFLDSTGRELSQLWGAVDTTTLASWMIQNGYIAMDLDLHPELRAWLQAPLRFDTITNSNWTHLRVGLVSSEATVARRCYQRDMAACRLTLGLAETADTARAWYDAPARRAFVRRHEWMARRADPEATRRCLDGHDESCVLAIQRGGIARHPASPAHRVSLAQLAMQLGGAGAVDRLTQTRGDASARLQAASGIPTDSLLARWLDRVRGMRTPSDDISATIVGTSLLWVLVFGSLALRSSRWR